MNEHDRLMTRDEFVSYAEDYLFGEGAEGIWEMVAEHNSEVAMFGDAGPGSGYRLQKMLATWHSIANRYEQLTGNVVRNRPKLRAPR